MQYQIWTSTDGSISLFPVTSKVAASLQNRGAELVLEFEADSFEQAVQVEYDHFGWGTYQPMEKEN